MNFAIDSYEKEKSVEAKEIKLFNFHQIQSNIEKTTKGVLFSWVVLYFTL